MPDSSFLEAAKTVPALLVLCWIVWANSKSVEKLQGRLLDAIDRNSEALRALESTIAQLLRKE